MIQSTYSSVPDTVLPARPDSQPHAAPWVAGLGIATLGTWLLYAALPGLNWTLWTMFAAAAFAWSERSGGKRLPAARIVPLMVAGVLAGGAAVTAQPFMHGLILLSLGMLAAVLTLLTAGLPAAQLGLGALITAPFRAPVTCLLACGGELRAAMGLARAEGSVPYLRGTLLALPAGMVFYLLLSGADPTMAGWREAAWQALLALSFLPRTLFFMVLLVASLGVFTLAAQSPTISVAASPAGRQSGGTLQDVERSMVLGVVAAVFALFLVLQVSYLFGNPGGRTGSGLSYADAVHRGFGELTVAATLCLLLALVLDRRALRGTREALVRGLTLIVIAEAGLLLVSAHLRVQAYEEAYGYTLQRLYVHAHTIMTAVALALLAWEVWVSIDAGRLFRRLGLAAALAVATFAYWNHAAWIARHNVARYQHTGSIDIDYLVRALGDDAVPEITRALPALSAPLAQQARSQLEAARQSHLRNGDAHWYDWNLRRAAAREALASLPRDTPGP